MNVDNVKNLNGAPVPSAPKPLRKGRIKAPYRVLLYGPEKVGKSTFAMGADSPIWLGREHGTEHLDIPRLPQPETWREVFDRLGDVERRVYGDEFKTLVVDPLGWFEPLIHLDVTGDVNVPLVAWNGGFGKGVAAAADRWRMLINAIERVWKTGLNVILIGHSTDKRFDDPEGPGYARYELALENKAAAGFLKQWVDHILFAKREAFGKVDPQTKRAKAYGSAARMLYTEWSPAYDAGNRASLPPEMPLDWHTFAEALVKGEERRATFLKQIDDGLRELADVEVEKKVRVWLADPKADVGAIANAVAAKLGEKRAQAQEQTPTTKEG